VSDNEALIRRIEEAIKQKGFPVRRDGGLITHVNGVYVGVWVMPVGRTAKTVLRIGFAPLVQEYAQPHAARPEELARWVLDWVARNGDASRKREATPLTVDD
jgi:hypothetical protein